MQDNLERFTELNAQVLGISVDSVYAHRAFAARIGRAWITRCWRIFIPRARWRRPMGCGAKKRATAGGPSSSLIAQGLVRYSRVIERGAPDVEHLLNVVRNTALESTGRS